MARSRGGPIVLAAGMTLALLAAVAALLVWRSPRSAATSEPSASTAQRDVDSSPTPRAAGAPPSHRPRVQVDRRARDAAAADADRRLDDLAALRRALQQAPGRAGAAGAAEAAPTDELVVSRHRDGREFRRGWLRGGVRDGLWSETFESGARVETSYRRGLRHGQEAAWHPDGKPRFLGEYADGEMSGTWTAWHASGHLLSTRQYVAGKLAGLLRTFHDNGALAEESRFVAGAEDGVNRGWHANGYLAWEIVYVAGERQGPAAWFDDRGVQKAAGTYLAGELHGPYVEYAPDGTVKRTEQWDHGHRLARAEQPE